ncbi:MAG: MBL fold metallo-hydrolase, partial [Acidobacteriota bacterium]|nr:MBL fold metallo-hydrolase [Acidobacteriota bacterium]
MKVDGVTILTDPVFSEKIGIGLGPMTLGMTRIVGPALGHTEIPRPDIVLLSHAHMDHFDLPSLRALESEATNVVTAARTSDLLRARYRSIHELAWGDSVRFGETEIQAFEVNHWGARLRSDTYRGFNGYVIETRNYRVLFGGDTA